VWPLVGGKSVNTIQCEDLSEVFQTASHVFEAVVLSKSPQASDAGVVSLKLRKCFKGTIKSYQLRMNFSSTLLDSPMEKCGIKTTDLLANKKYIVFANEVWKSQFWPLTRPVEKTKLFARKLRHLMCKKCSNVFTFHVGYLALRVIHERAFPECICPSAFLLPSAFF